MCVLCEMVGEVLMVGAGDAAAAAAREGDGLVWSPGGRMGGAAAAAALVWM